MSEIEWDVGLAGNGNYGFTVTIKDGDGNLQAMEVVVAPSPGKCVKGVLKRFAKNMPEESVEEIRKALFKMLPDWREKDKKIRGQMRVGRALTWKADKVITSSDDLEKDYLKSRILHGKGLN